MEEQRQIKRAEDKISPLEKELNFTDIQVQQFPLHEYLKFIL